MSLTIPADTSTGLQAAITGNGHKTAALFLPNWLLRQKALGKVLLLGCQIEGDVPEKHRRAVVPYLFPLTFHPQDTSHPVESRCLSVQFSRSVMSDSLRPHESQHARPPSPSPTPGVHPNPCPLLCQQRSI